MQSADHRNGGSSSRWKSNTAGVDDDVPVKLEGRAIVAPQVESVLPIAIGPQPAAPFDTELLLRQRRRSRGHEVEIDPPLDAHNSRPEPVPVRGELHCNPPLWPDPKDRYEEDRHEKENFTVIPRCGQTQRIGTRRIGTRRIRVRYRMFAPRPHLSREEVGSRDGSPRGPGWPVAGGRRLSTAGAARRSAAGGGDSLRSDRRAPPAPDDRANR